MFLSTRLNGNIRDLARRVLILRVHALIFGEYSTAMSVTPALPQIEDALKPAFALFISIVKHYLNSIAPQQDIVISIGNDTVKYFVHCVHVTTVTPKQTRLKVRHPLCSLSEPRGN